MNSKEQQRALVLGKVDRGDMSRSEAAQLLQVSERQVYRLCAAYRTAGAAGLVHGNRGRTPAHALAPEQRARVVELARDARYAGCNHSHFTELIAEEVPLSRSSVRRILLAAGLPSPRPRRVRQRRERRERRAQPGLLLQWDGSRHAWLEDRGPVLTLIGAIDDATGEVVGACFREQEDAQGYLLVLQAILRGPGIPVAIYRDRHGIFERAPREGWTLAEDLAGARLPTQVGRCLEELGITSIPAGSPQAKGRIERLWGTFQERLVVALRLAHARTLTEANAVLPGFLAAYNQRFQVPAREPGSGYRPVPPGLDLAAVCCFKYARRVGNDNTVTLGEHRLQLQPSGGRQSFARAEVEVQERLDGSLVVVYQGQVLSSTPAPPTAPQLRARQARRVAAAGHPAAAAPPVPREEGATPAAGVGMWATDATAVETQQSTAIVHMSTPTPHRPHTPAPDHPWRQRALPPTDKITDQLP